MIDPISFGAGLGVSAILFASFAAFRIHRAPRLTTVRGGSQAGPEGEVHTGPAVSPGCAGDAEPVRVDAAPVSQPPSSTPKAHAPTSDRLRDLAVKSADAHAAALLAFLQGPGGVAGGEITAAQMEDAYSDLCFELAWAPRPWISVARELRSALGQPRKTYAMRDGRKVRVWRVPHPEINQQHATPLAMAA